MIRVCFLHVTTTATPRGGHTLGRLGKNYSTDGSDNVYTLRLYVIPAPTYPPTHTRY